MRCDFTSHLERHGKDSIAVDGLGTGVCARAAGGGL